MLCCWSQQCNLWSLFLYVAHHCRYFYIWYITLVLLPKCMPLPECKSTLPPTGNPHNNTLWNYAWKIHLYVTYIQYCVLCCPICIRLTVCFCVFTQSCQKNRLTRQQRVGLNATSSRERNVGKEWACSAHYHVITAAVARSRGHWSSSRS